MKITAPIVIGVLGLLASAPAVAGCKSKDLAGRWDLYAIGAEYGVFWSHCSLTVARNGSLRRGTKCSYSDGTRTTVDGGRLRVNSSCRVSGYLEERLGSSRARVDVAQATMDRAKRMIVGVAGSASAGVATMFNAVKR
jgi:hypothetical protein